MIRSSNAASLFLRLFLYRDGPRISSADSVSERDSEIYSPLPRCTGRSDCSETSLTVRDISVWRLHRLSRKILDFLTLADVKFKRIRGYSHGNEFSFSKSLRKREDSLEQKCTAKSTGLDGVSNILDGSS